MGRAVLIILIGGALVAGAFYVGKHWARPAPVAAGSFLFTLDSDEPVCNSALYDRRRAGSRCAAVGAHLAQVAPGCREASRSTKSWSQCQSCVRFRRAVSNCTGGKLGVPLG